VWQRPGKACSNQPPLKHEPKDDGSDDGDYKVFYRYLRLH
jgi:hypothetical protein